VPLRSIVEDRREQIVSDDHGDKSRQQFVDTLAADVGWARKATLGRHIAADNTASRWRRSRSFEALTRTECCEWPSAAAIAGNLSLRSSIATIVFDSLIE
jgi:hypothetical protein